MREDLPNWGEQEQQRLDKLEAMEAAGTKPYEITKVDQEVHSQDILDHYDQYEGKIVKVAGRIMSKRGMGKVSFSDLRDRAGKIQIFSKIDALGEEAYKAWLNLDIGDLGAVEGEVFSTQRV